MKITIKDLEKIDACTEAKEWFNNLPKKEYTVKYLAYKLLKENHFGWFIYGFRLLDKKQCVKIAIYSAKSVLHLFEDEYPDDSRPRKAIEAAEKCLKNSNAADAANTAVYANADATNAANAANAAYAAYAASAANAAYCAAYTAANAAYCAAYTAANTYAAAYTVANTIRAIYAANAANADIRKKIVKYILTLI